MEEIRAEATNFASLYDDHLKHSPCLQALDSLWGNAFPSLLLAPCSAPSSNALLLPRLAHGC